jgi:hypothetical protein
VPNGVAGKDEAPAADDEGETDACCADVVMAEVTRRLTTASIRTPADDADVRV